MAAAMQGVQNITTFQKSIPYGACSLGTGIVGAVLCTSATTTAAIVMGVALAILGAYAFIGVVACGLAHSGDPEKFEANVGQIMVSFATTGIADLIASVAKAVVFKLIFDDRR